MLSSHVTSPLGKWASSSDTSEQGRRGPGSPSRGGLFPAVAPPSAQPPAAHSSGPVEPLELPGPTGRARSRDPWRLASGPTLLVHRPPTSVPGTLAHLCQPLACSQRACHPGNYRDGLMRTCCAYQLPIRPTRSHFGHSCSLVMEDRCKRWLEVHFLFYPLHEGCKISSTYT